jgi:hypothetical protein
MIDIALQAAEFDCGLDSEVEGWLALTFPKQMADLESSRRTTNEHMHRKIVTRIVSAYKRENPGNELEWSSPVGPVRIVVGKAKAPDEVSLSELDAAYKAGTPEPFKTIVLSLLATKKAMGGGILTDCSRKA